MSMRLVCWVFVVLGVLSALRVHGQPASAKRSLERAVAAMNAKRYREAESILRSIVKRYPHYADARYELALALSLQNKYDEAIELCSELCDTTLPRSMQREQYFQLLGDLYSQQDDTTRAFATYRIGLERFPNSARLHVQLALLLKQRGQLDSALAEIERAIEADPTYPLSYYWGARFYRTSSEPIWAILYAEIYLNLRPNSSRADEMSALWYNLFREAVEQFDEEKRIVLWQPSHHTISDSTQRRPFPELYTAVLAECIRQLQFNRDFELPLASLDTLIGCFIARWKALGYDTVYRNVLLERYDQLAREGLLSAYIHVLGQYGKPMQYAEYAKNHRKLLMRLERWIDRHRLAITPQNRICRACW
jgi:outer membrane protein assembly factor BamD (BamD/ComL family)